MWLTPHHRMGRWYALQGTASRQRALDGHCSAIGSKAGKRHVHRTLRSCHVPEALRGGSAHESRTSEIRRDENNPRSGEMRIFPTGGMAMNKLSNIRMVSN